MSGMPRRRCPKAPISCGARRISYGDYCAAAPSPRVRRSWTRCAIFAAGGGLVLGVCNGFQILCEAGLLPGVLMPTRGLKFICHDVHLRVERSDTPFTRGYNAGQIIRVPIAHGEGNYEADQETLKRRKGGASALSLLLRRGRVDEQSNITAPRNRSPASSRRGNVLA